MAHWPFWLQLIGAIGVGAITTRILDVVWLHRVMQQNEDRRWLRDRRFAAYSALSRELISHGLWSGSTTEAVVDGLVAEAILVTDNGTLARRIEGYFRDVRAARQKISKLQGKLQVGDPNVKPQVLQELIQTDFERRDAEAREIVRQLAQDLRH